MSAAPWLALRIRSCSSRSGNATARLAGGSGMAFSIRNVSLGSAARIAAAHEFETAIMRSECTRHVAQC
jgi:hypothetical protein